MSTWLLVPDLVYHSILRDIGLWESCLRWSAIKSFTSKVFPRDPYWVQVCLTFWVIADAAAEVTHMYVYADDTILYSTNSSLVVALSLLQSSFNSLQHAFSNLHLWINKMSGFLRKPITSWVSSIWAYGLTAHSHLKHTWLLHNKGQIKNWFTWLESPSFITQLFIEFVWQLLIF